MRKLVVVCLALSALFVFSACTGSASPQTAAGGISQTTVDFKIPRNAQGHSSEQQNIIDRLKVTTDPAKVMWIHLIALDGKIVKRMAVANKVTSSGKRLEPTQASSRAQYGNEFPKTTAPNGRTYDTPELLQPDGTFGSSDAYIYWFDPQHRYHQWGTAGGLGYLLTDYPIDLSNQIDEITGMYNADKAAYEWQLRQEAQLCAKEGKKIVEGECK